MPFEDHLKRQVWTLGHIIGTSLLVQYSSSIRARQSSARSLVQNEGFDFDVRQRIDSLRLEDYECFAECRACYQSFA